MTFLTILLFFFMALTVAILVTGVVVMIRGGETNAKYGNKLMMARVISQAVALGILALLFLFPKK